MNLRKEGKVYLALILAMIFWGMSFIWYKQAFQNFLPLSVIFLRLLISFPLLLLFAIILRRIRWPRLPDLKYFLLLALFEPFLYFICESYGLVYLSSTLASVILATIPLITPISAYYFYKERLTVNNFIGIFLSFLGVILVVYAEGRSGNAPWFGILLIFLAVISTQGYAILLKRLSGEYNALSIVWFQNLIGSIYFLPLFFLLEYKKIPWKILTMSDYLPVIYLSLFASAIAFIFFIEGIKKLGMTRAVVFTNFIPIVTAIFAVIILNENFSLMKAGGIFTTILGLFMSQAAGFPKIRIFSRVK
jgi:drug/metabolite transporter (DMT)-like permease